MVDAIPRVVQKFPLEALFVGFSPVGNQTMLSYAQTMGPKRLSVDNAVSQARTETTNAVAKSNKARSTQFTKNLEVSKKKKSAAAKKASSGQFQKAMSELTRSARSLRASATELADNDKAVRNREVSTSNPGVASVRAEAGESTGSFELKVKNVAQAQENRGRALSSESTGNFDSGRQFIELESSGQSKRLSVAIKPNDSNAAALGKLASSINNSGMELQAEVVDVNEGASAQLVVRANQTGQNASFSMRDVVGTIVERSGASSVAQPPSNAEFSVNGNAQESQGNFFVVDSGRIEVNLQQRGDTEINVVRDRGMLFGAVDQLLVEMNQFRDTVTRADAALNKDIAAEFERHLEEISDRLAEMELSFESSQENSTLALDRDSLEAAALAQPQQLESALVGDDGLAGRMAGFAMVVEQASAVELVGLEEPQDLSSDAGADFASDSGAVVNDAV